MAGKSKIGWTDASWNPIRGCSRVSQGCAHCYAERAAARFSGEGQPYEGLAVMGSDGPRWTGEVRLVEELLDWPLRRRLPLRIFVNSMSDLFHEAVPDEWIDRIFAVMSLARGHVFQVLTKRPERMLRYLTSSASGDERRDDVVTHALEMGTQVGKDGLQRFCDDDCLIQPNRWPLPNVWLGVSVEDQATADERIPLLLQTPAAVRWISAEPLLGGINLIGTAGDPLGDDGGDFGKTLAWVVVGGESGPGARPMHPDWARSLRDQCQAAGVPFFFKQWGEWLGLHSRDDGKNGIGFTAGIPCHAIKTIRRWDGDTPRGYGAGESTGNFMPPGTALSVRTGKKAAGRRLDGREWNEFPAARA